VNDQFMDQHRDGRFTDPAERQAGDGNAQLRGGDVGVEVGESVKDRDRTAVAFGGKLLHASAPDRNQREFGGDEKTIGEDK
jgi:hypothetical protein